MRMETRTFEFGQTGIKPNAPETLHQEGLPLKENIAPYLNQIAHDGCVTAMRQLPDACVDLVVTDSP